MARSATHSFGPNSGKQVPELSEEQKRRFLEKVARGPVDSCWLWSGVKDKSGYGKVCVNYRFFRAHRVAYSIAFGSIPAGKVVAHRCNTPGCCNPSHLELNTQSENMAYSVKLGRTKVTPPVGEQCKQTPLTAAQVQEMRLLYDQGNISQTMLGAQYGITQSSVGAIVRRKTWRHVP